MFLYFKCCFYKVCRKIDVINMIEVFCKFKGRLINGIF